LETQNPNRQNPYLYVVKLSSGSRLFQYVGGPNPVQVAFIEIVRGPEDTLCTAVVDVVKFPMTIAPSTTMATIMTTSLREYSACLLVSASKAETVARRPL